MKSSGSQNFMQSAPPRRRRRAGCFVRSLITLIVILILVVGGWFFIVRPYLHSLVQNKIDQVLTTAVDQIDPVRTSLIPAGTPVPVTETFMDNLFTLNTAPSDPVQNEQAHITTNGVRLDFTVYGFPCAISGVPQLVNNQLVVNNVTVEGIAALVMSPDEMAAVLNRHLADAQGRLNRPITAVNLQDHQLTLILG